jgi:hypothetical protein
MKLSLYIFSPSYFSGQARWLLVLWSHGRAVLTPQDRRHVPQLTWWQMKSHTHRKMNLPAVAGRWLHNARYNHLAIIEVYLDRLWSSIRLVNSPNLNPIQ